MATSIDTKKVQSKAKTALGYMGWFIIYTAVVAGISFYYGTQFQDRLHANQQAAVAQVAESPKQ